MSTRQTTTHLAFILLAALAANAVLASTIELDTGSLELGGALEADHVIIGAGATLAGTGTVAAPTVVGGTVSPGTGAVATLGTLTFTDTLAFAPGSHYLCHAATSTDLDRLVVAGAVTGTVQFIGSRAEGATPDRQVVVDGGAGSDYALFAAVDPEYWRLRVAGDDLLLRYGLTPRGTLIMIPAD
jgi:hypothetical protein